MSADFLMAVTWQQPFYCGVCGQMLENVVERDSEHRMISPVHRREAVLRCINSHCEKYDIEYVAPATLVELKRHVR